MPKRPGTEGKRTVRSERGAAGRLTRRPEIGVGIALALFTACSGGGGGGGGPAGGDPLAARAEFSDEDIHHFLSRTHFGVRRAEFEAVQQLGLPEYVDAMLELPEPGTTAWDVAAREELVNVDDPVGYEGMFPSTTDLARWWERLMLHSEHPFQEEVAFFWHDHFATSSAVLSTQERHWMVNHVNLFREHGTGNLRDLLLAVSRDWAMAEWLDQTINDQFDINENYAREFWELFTLGVDNGYSEVDIRESAEAHSGLDVVYDPDTNLSSVVFLPEEHADGYKNVLGQLIEAQHGAGELEHDDVEAVVDITLGFTGPHGGVAEFVCGKILEHYWGPEPPDELVDGLAAVLRDGGWELKPVFATLFKSEAFYSAEAKQGVIKSPVEATVGFMRSTGLLVEPYRIDYSLVEARQRPTQPPDVNGWEQGEELLSTVAMMETANMAADAIEARTYQTDELGLDLATLLPDGPRLAGDVIDYWAGWLDVQLSADEQALLVEYLDTRRNYDGTIVPSLFTAADPSHLEERLRGLLYILAQHPTFLQK